MPTTQKRRRILPTVLKLLNFLRSTCSYLQRVQPAWCEPIKFGTRSFFWLDIVVLIRASVQGYHWAGIFPSFQRVKRTSFSSFKVCAFLVLPDFIISGKYSNKIMFRSFSTLGSFLYSMPHQFLFHLSINSHYKVCIR